MAKAVVALNLQLFEHMRFQLEKDYYKVYIHINRNVLAEYEKIKRLKKTAEKDQVLSEFMWKLYKPPSTKPERSQE